MPRDVAVDQNGAFYDFHGLPRQGDQPLDEVPLRVQRILEDNDLSPLRVREGDLPAASDVRVLANYYSTVMQGLSMQARDGATREELEALVAPAMAALS